MVESLISAGIVGGLAAVLAALLVLAQRFISNYGACTININNGNRTLTVEGGNSLLESLTSNKIFIPSACGGRGTCAYCKLKVLEGGGPMLPTEEPYIVGEQREQGVRLSCQVKVRNDLRIEIPEELFLVKQFACRCAKITDLTHDIKEFRFELNDPPEVAFTPGQYAQLFTPPYNGNEDVYRAYSISSDPRDKGAIELVIRLVPGGICTTYCFEHMKEGDPVTINGPYGDFMLSETDAPIIFIAGGSGMAPIKSILHQMRNENIQREAVYFFGSNLVKELFYHEQMAEFEKDLPNFKYVPVVARPEEGADWTGETGLVTEAVGRTYSDLSGHEAYLCGSPGMIDASIKVLKELGMPEANVFYDKFA